jgi:hypothetical protein
MTSPDRGLKAFLRRHWAILLPAFVYCYIFPWLPALRSPNELCRLYQTRAIADHGTMEINDVMKELGPIGDLSCVAVQRDPASQAIIARRPCPAVRGRREFREEHYYPSKAPLLAVVAVPVYAALKAFRQPVPETALVFFGRLFCTILPAALSLIPLRRFLRAYVEPPIANAVVATYALGSLAFSYSELFMSHQTTAVLLFLCFYVLWRIGRREWPVAGYLLAGAFAGLSVAAEYTGALALPPLAVYALATAPSGARGRGAAIALGLLGLTPFAGLLGWYHQAAFGDPFQSGYRYLNDAGYQSWHEGGFLGIKLPDPKALLLSFFSPLRGLFVLSPFLMLALPGLAPRFWLPDRRRELALTLGLLALYTYFTSSFSYESWGWTTGPRHLTPLIPFLLLPIALVLQVAQTRPILAGAGGGLMLLSIIVTSALTFIDYISDSLTKAFYEVALPLAFSGHLPNNVLALAGVPNPWAALPAVVAIFAVVSLAVASVIPAGRALPSLASAGVVTLVLAVALALVPTEGGAERQQREYRFLADQWSPQPGHASPPLWGKAEPSHAPPLRH